MSSTPLFGLLLLETKIEKNMLLVGAHVIKKKKMHKKVKVQHLKYLRDHDEVEKT